MSSEAFIKKLADLLEVEEDEIDLTFALSNGSWDSLAIMETIALIDEIYSITVPTDNLKQCNTVGDLLELTQKYVL